VSCDCDRERDLDAVDGARESNAPAGVICVVVETVLSLSLEYASPACARLEARGGCWW
jgi:hypothetical protein